MTPTTKKSLLVLFCCFAVLALAPIPRAFAQVENINQVRIFSEFVDDPTSVFSFTNDYPSLVSLSDTSVDNGGAAGGFANRRNWRFSGNGGVSDFLFTNDTFFDVSFDLTLSGNATPRKEAGFLLDTIGGQGQFIVNTDAHEVVAFGGPLPFFKFNDLGLSFNEGDTIRLGMTYFLDEDGKRKIIYRANDLSSGALEFTNLEQGIIDNSTLGGYLQTVIDRNNPDNGATADFRNIGIRSPAAAVIPEPSSLLLCAGGLAALVLRRRRRNVPDDTHAGP
jgi:hypothetical protein